MDVVAIVDHLASIGWVRTRKVSGDWYQMFCPFHGDGKEKKPSFGVLIREQYRAGQRYPQGFAHCFACGYAKTFVDFVSDLLKQNHIDQSGLDWLVKNIPGFEAEVEEDLESLVPKNLMDAMTNKFAIDYIKRMTEQKTVSYVSEEELASYRFVVPYMYERGLTDELIEKFDVGVDMKFVPPGRKKPVPSITFPVRDREGRTLFFCRRSIEGKFFNYPEDVVKPLYGIDVLPAGCKSVIICESCFNVITATKYGYPAVAMLGTGNAYQIQQLKELGCSEFVLGFDGDEAGKRATNKLKRALSSVAIIWTMNLPAGKDINDLSEDEFAQVYANRE